jgi:hypothetical protein
MSNKLSKITEKIFNRIKEQSSNSMGGGSFTPGTGAQHGGKSNFSKTPYYYKLGYKAVPNIKPKSFDKKQLWEDTPLNEYNDFQKERISIFDQIETELNQVSALISNAKNETSEFYSNNPGSYEIVIPTDLILDYLKNIKTLLKEEE